MCVCVCGIPKQDQGKLVVNILLKDGAVGSGSDNTTVRTDERLTSFNA